MARTASRRVQGRDLAVTRDRYFLDNVAEWILELDRGRAYPYEGNYSTYLEKKAERVAVQGRRTPSCRSDCRRNSPGSVGRQGSAGQEQGAAGAL